jgi:hypothetical protein
MVFLIYGSAAILAIALLYFFHANWYWHVISVGLALAIGAVPSDVIPMPAAWGPTRDILIGAIFTFLVIWGIGAPLFRRHHQPAQHAAS